MGVLAKQCSHHQLHSAANLVPPHRHHLPVVQMGLWVIKQQRTLKPMVESVGIQLSLPGPNTAKETVVPHDILRPIAETG